MRPWTTLWRILGAVLGLACAFVVLLPIIWMVSAAFRPDSDLSTFPPALFPRDVTASNFVEVFERLPFGRLYANTVGFAGTVTVVSLTLDTFAGYALARLRFRGSDIVLVGIVVVLMLPFQVTLVPLYEMMQRLGLVGTLPGLILPRIANAFGIFFMRQFFLSLPKDLEDAGRIDGASEWKVFSKIILPLARPGLLTLGLFHFQANWNDLIWPLIMTNRLTDATLPAGLAMFTGQSSIQYGLTMAGSVLALAPLVVAFCLVQRSFVESIATTGIK